jgi:putative flippase GtrA
MHLGWFHARSGVKPERAVDKSEDYLRNVLISRDTYIQITKFSIVGFICFGIDLSVYYFASQFWPTWISKVFGFGAGILTNYNLNKWWTWGERRHTGKLFARYITLYGVSGLLNILSNELFLKLLPNREIVVSFRDSQGLIDELFAFKADKIFAVILATGVSMVVNFWGQKKWVFSRS